VKIPPSLLAAGAFNQPGQCANSSGHTAYTVTVARALLTADLEKRPQKTPKMHRFACRGLQFQKKIPEFFPEFVTAQCTIVQKARSCDRMYDVVRLSVHLFVRLVDCGHIGWKS